MRRIRHLPLIDRPREKLTQKGAASLSDFELFEVVIGSGSGGVDVGTIARQLQKLLQKGIAAFTLDALCNIPGVDQAHATKLLASLELARRHLVRDVEPLRTIDDVLARCDDIRVKQQEYVVCFSLDGGQRLIAQRIITIGTLDKVLVHPREVFADAVMDRAAAVVVVHNHPSGEVRPSHHDITLTQQLVAAGQLLGVPLRDHIIVTKTEYYSCRQHHFL